MKLKICGMKYPENIKDVARLQPDYMGFIFYDKSPRNFDGDMPAITEQIKRTGVFVNASIDFIFEKVRQYDLKAVQLHGDESPDFCKEVMQKKVELIKVFSVGEVFSFHEVKAYENACDYYLFDTKGKERGGNGKVFNWSLLNDYTFQKPYFLSGGIGLEQIESLRSFKKSKASRYCYALDLNSRFEEKPGLKNIEKLKKLKQDLKLDL